MGDNFRLGHNEHSARPECLFVNNIVQLPLHYRGNVYPLISQLQIRRRDDKADMMDGATKVLDR